VRDILIFKPRGENGDRAMFWIEDPKEEAAWCYHHYKHE
jgi:hypothetical protein